MLSTVCCFFNGSFSSCLRYYFAIISSALVLSSPGSFAQTVDESVLAVVLQTLETNPEVQIHWHAFQAAGFDTRVARAGYLPSLDLNAGTGQQSRDFDGRGGYETNQLQISLTQMLFDGFRTRSDVQRLEKAQQVRLFELLGAVDETALEAVRAYDDVVRYRILLDLVRVNYEQHLSIESQIREQVEQGVGRGTDLDQVSGRVALMESNLLAEAANLHDVTARYLRVVGELPLGNAQAVELRYESLPESIRDVLYAAYQGNSNFHASITNISASQASVSQQRAGYFPKVELRARTGMQQNLGFFDDRVDPDSFGNDTVVELALTYNLYRGGADRASILRSLALVDEARAQRDQACVNLRQSVQIAYSDTQRIDERLIALRQHRDAIDRVRGSYAEQFQIGQRTLLDVLDAENEFFQASRAVIDAEHSLTLAHVELLAASGKLLPALGIVNQELMFLGVDGDLSSIDVEPSAACPAISPRSHTRADLIIASFVLETDVLFETGLSTLTPRASVVLDRLIQDLDISDRNVIINIEAHADNRGSDEINLPLSQARARAVRDYLIINGLMTDLMQVKGFGSSQPVASNDTEEGRRANRRVEITASMPNGGEAYRNLEAAVSNAQNTANSAQTVSSIPSMEQLNQTISDWLDSWQQQDVARYFTHFHSNYVPSELMSIETWRTDRSNKISSPTDIEISYEDMEIIESNGISTIVRFTMFYSNSTGYRDETMKELVLINENGRLLIETERNLEVIVR